MCNCPDCGKPLLAISITEENEACDSCFVCRGCNRRVGMYVMDPPPMNKCDDCLGIFEPCLMNEE